MSTPLTIITWQDVVNVSPEMVRTPLPAQTEILIAVGLQVPVNQWGKLQAQGQAYLAAHLGTLARRRGDGPTTSKSAGGLSQSFASLTALGALGMTSYGVEYQRLIRLLPTIAFGMVV